MKTKEELLKIALSGHSNTSYKLSPGFDEADKFLKAFKITTNEGKNIPVRVVYYFYYLWVKEAEKTPLLYKSFCIRMNKYVKSKPYSDMVAHLHFRAYKLKNFPYYTEEDELQARRIINVQKRNRKAKETRRRNKKILQSQN